MKIVFIAGPYFGNGSYEVIEQNIQEAEATAIELANRGIHFFCPHLHTRHFEKKATAGEPFYHELDRAILIRLADAVLALPRWKESAGARAEIALANELGIPVFYRLSPKDLAIFDEIARWAREQ